MQLHELVNTIGQDLQHRYGEKVHKLTLHGGFNCPNRDGTIGRGGCTFCNVSSFVDENVQIKPIETQLADRAGEVKRAKKYLAYFQAYTNTYAEVQTLKAMYEEALQSADMVGLCVGTRPDCVPDAVLELLSGYVQQGYEIWLELGLQTANDATLKRINRGHDFACYADITQRARALGIKVCTHLIIGLPKENRTDYFETFEKVMQVGMDGLKLHPLHIVEGSTMAKAWRAGRLDAPEMDEYVEVATEIIRRTPAHIIYHRVSAAARRPTLLSPLWCENRWFAMTEIGRALDKHGPQGSTGFISYHGDSTASLELTGTLAELKELFDIGINFTGDIAGDATITMTTSDNGNTGSGDVLTDEDSFTVSVAGAAAFMASPALMSTTRYVPNVSVTAAQLALIPLLGLLSEHVQASDLDHIRIDNLDSGKLVNSVGETVGEQQDDGSWIVTSQDLADAYLTDLPEGDHSLTVEAVSHEDAADTTIDEPQTTNVDIDVQTDSEDALTATAATDHSVVVGDDTNDVLVGTSSHDVLIGGAGNDILVGGAGADILIGGSGNDELWGGERYGSGDGETDTFVWHAKDIGTTASPAIDVIKDFELNVDKIDIRGLLKDMDSNGINMDDLLAGVKASEQDGKINLTVNNEQGGEQVIVLDNISADSFGLDSGASSNDIVSNLYQQHKAFTVDH